MKPKVALVKDGFTEPNGKVWTAGDENKRGRLSLAGNERLKELSAQGWNIDGFTVSNNLPSSTGPVEVTKTKTTDFGVMDIPDEARREEDWEAFTSEGAVGMRTVENTCGNSLTYCRCPSPKVWLDSDRQGAVQFKPRTNPVKRWY